MRRVSTTEASGFVSPPVGLRGLTRLSGGVSSRRFKNYLILLIQGNLASPRGLPVSLSSLIYHHHRRQRRRRLRRDSDASESPGRVPGACAEYGSTGSARPGRARCAGGSGFCLVGVRGSVCWAGTLRGCEQCLHPARFVSLARRRGEARGWEGGCIGRKREREWETQRRERGRERGR